MFANDPRRKINNNRVKLLIEGVLWLGVVMLVIYVFAKVEPHEPEPLPRPVSFEAARF